MAAAHSGLIAAAIELAPIALAIAGVGYVGIAGVAGHQSETFAPGTLGHYLQDKQASIATLSTGAMRDQQEVSLAALLQTTRLVVRTRFAFRDQLGAKIESLNAPAKAAVSNIETALQTLGQSNTAAVRETGDRAQAAADQLAVPSQFPQVRSFGPHFLFSSLPFQTITIRGDFPRQYPAGVVPELRIEDRTYKAFAFDAQGISFSLPSDALGAAHLQTIVWKKADLSVPWEHPRFDTFARAGNENFVVIGLLPHAAGRVTIDHRVTNYRTEEATRASDAFSLNPGLGETEQTACLSLGAKEVAEGWKVKPGSGALVPVTPAASAGDWQDLGRQSENERSICWKVSLAPSASNRPYAWKVSALLSRETLEARMASETFDLAWGGNRSFPYPPGTWKVRYAKYDGTQTEVSSTDRVSPLFRVETDTRNVKVSAFPF